MRLKVALLAVAVAAVCLVPVTAGAKKTKPKKSATVYYLALGDSLSVGGQPNAAGKTVVGKHGYTNVLFAAEKKKIKHLKLMELGCLGETTTSMINGTGSQCHYAAGSQLKAADAFIKKHKANIAFVTIDIGANDVDGCVSGTTVNGPCIAAGQKSISTNIPKIAAALRKAGGSKLKIVGMTYFDPFLADYLGGATGKGLATASQGLAKTVNGDISTGYAGSSVKVADVATSWKTYDPLTGPGSQTTTYKGQTVPVPVAIVCERTWMCAAKPKGPNIHANNTGYKDIEKVFKPLV